MNNSSRLNAPQLLEAFHNVVEFDCGIESLNDYLRRFAYINNQNGSSRTYVSVRDKRVVGYYTLTPGAVSKEQAPERIGKGLANRPVAVIILARLAVDKFEQGTGLGRGLLRDSLMRIIYAADVIGGRAVLVHAKDKQAKAFYEHFGFEASSIDPFHLYLLMKDIKKTFGM